MKLKYILGEREINKNEIFSTGECETVNNGIVVSVIGNYIMIIQMFLISI
jgi:hypothetical protein